MKQGVKILLKNSKQSQQRYYIKISSETRSKNIIKKYQAKQEVKILLKSIKLKQKVMILLKNIKLNKRQRYCKILKR